MQNPVNSDDLESDRISLLLPDVAHEIRNLMQSIQGLAELECRHATDSLTSSRLQKISEQAQFAAELTSSLLRVSRAVPERLAGDVAEAVETAVSLLQSDFGRGVLLQCDVRRGIPPVSLPTGFLELILLNLSKNAVEALRDSSNPVVCISASRDGSHVTLKVWNNGPHIPSELLERLFEHQLTTKATTGHGFGLGVVRKLAERAGGTACVQNIAGGGVQFMVTLPIALSLPRTVFKAAPHPTQTMFGRRFLVIDDDPSVREVLALMIKDLGGGSVKTCESGAQALALNDCNFDVVLLDMRMKGLSGRETFQHLAPELQRKVVFVTGDVITPTTRKFIDATVRPVLIKPISFSQLCEAVAQKAS